jgi:hypothetical protein
MGSPSLEEVSIGMNAAFLYSEYMIRASQSSRLNQPDYIWWTIQSMKFLNMEPYPLTIRISLGSKYLKKIWHCPKIEEAGVGVSEVPMKSYDLELS